jgi:hypothetical protein
MVNAFLQVSADDEGRAGNQETLFERYYSI